jgi:outer membrane protein assembly factor BamB
VCCVLTPRLYIGTERGTLYAIHATTGYVLWKQTPQPGSSIVASVAIDRSGDIYFTSSYNHVFSDDASTVGGVR